MIALLVLCTAVLSAADEYAEGVKLVGAGEFRDALGKFEQAIELDPTNENAYRYAAMCHEKLEQWERAQKYWEAYQALASSAGAQRMAGERIALCKSKQAAGESPAARRVDVRSLAKVHGKLYTARTDRFIVHTRNPQLAQLAGQYAEEYLSQLTTAFMRGIAWPRVSTVNIYANHKEYVAKSGMPAWSNGGYQYRRLSVDRIIRRIVLIQIGMDGKFDANLLTQVLPHELTHLVLHEYFGERPIPLALNEGLAMYMERGRAGKYESGLAEAVRAGKYIPFRTLYASMAYPKEAGHVGVFYAESASATRFLVSELKIDGMGILLGELKRGQSMDAAVRTATGGQGDVMGGIERKWRRGMVRRESRGP